MASFQAEIGWKRVRKSENKKYHFISSLSRLVIENYKKIAKKLKKLKKIPLWLYFNPKSVGNHETERK